MYCQELPIAEFLELPRANSILIIAERNRVDAMIKELRIDEDQEFRSMGYNTRQIVGKYDIAVIDGIGSNLDPYTTFDSMYPYLNQNVETFYILTDE